jgi:hypothetical protein
MASYNETPRVTIPRDVTTSEALTATCTSCGDQAYRLRVDRFWTHSDSGSMFCHRSDPHPGRPDGPVTVRIAVTLSAEDFRRGWDNEIAELAQSVVCRLNEIDGDDGDAYVPQIESVEHR